MTNAKKYNYICNNVGCPPRIIGCPIPSMSVHADKCPFCGCDMVKIIRCECGEIVTFNANFCSACGKTITAAPMLENKVSITSVQD